MIVELHGPSYLIIQNPYHVIGKKFTTLKAAGLTQEQIDGAKVILVFDYPELKWIAARHFNAGFPPRFVESLALEIVKRELKRMKTEFDLGLLDGDYIDLYFEPTIGIDKIISKITIKSNGEIISECN